MKILILLFVPLILLSCANKKTPPLTESKINELKVFITAMVKESDSTNKIDSVRLIRIDTLTEYNQIFAKYKRLENDLDNTNDLIKSHQNLANNYISQAKLINGISSELLEYYKGEAIKENSKGIELINETKQQLVVLDTLTNKLKRADTVTATHYEAVCLYQLRKKDMSVVRDTAYVILNKDKNIIRFDEYNKY